MHTKEPWTYYHEKIGDCFVVRSNEQGAIAETFTSSDRDHANAILIAQAPAMLANCEAALAALKVYTSDGPAIRSLEHVIRKARGE